MGLHYRVILLKIGKVVFSQKFLRYSSNYIHLYVQYIVCIFYVQRTIISIRNPQIFWNILKQIKHLKQSFVFSTMPCFKNSFYKWYFFVFQNWFPQMVMSQMVIRQMVSWCRIYTVDVLVLAFIWLVGISIDLQKIFW